MCPAAPAKENTKDEVYEFAGWRGYEDGMVLTRDISFVAMFNRVAVTFTKNSSIIKPDGDDFKVVEEVQQKPNDDKLQSVVNFKGTKHTDNYDSISSINPKTKGILGGRKTYSGSSVVVEMNNMSDAEKFQEINRRDVFDNGDDEVHQKIQLMTIKKAKGEPDGKAKIIKSVPKNKEANVVDEQELIDNIMVNKVKIDKKDD